MNVYPSHFHADQLTAHVLALLERRRAAVETWTEELELTLRKEAAAALAEAGAQFKEVADDPAYWAEVTRQVLELSLPRYFKVAREQHGLERRGYGVWRGGDLLSRAVYAVSGLAMGLVLARSGITEWLEPLPLGFFIFGPLIPDAQVRFAKRRYAKQLEAVVQAAKEEVEDRAAYKPYELEAAPPKPTTESTEAPAEGASTRVRP